MSWTETASPAGRFSARHDDRDADDAALVLSRLDGAAQDLEQRFPVEVDGVEVVLHRSPALLDAAQPWLPVRRALTAPAARRYVVGTVAGETLHVLAPRLLARRASNVEGSLEMLMLAPVALLARLVVTRTHPGLEGGPGPARLRRWLRWAWLLEGAAQFFSGQSAHVRPAAARRLREGPPPAFPPGRADATLLGGTVLDLLARERGETACVALARGPHPGGPRGALEAAFPNRALRATEAAWREHLERLAGVG